MDYLKCLGPDGRAIADCATFPPLWVRLTPSLRSTGTRTTSKAAYAKNINNQRSFRLIIRRLWFYSGWDMMMSHFNIIGIDEVDFRKCPNGNRLLSIDCHWSFRNLDISRKALDAVLEKQSIGVEGCSIFTDDLNFTSISNAK